MSDVRFPGEPPEYRVARDALTAAETELTRQVETVAAQRRSLPLGGVVGGDYLFSEGPTDLREDGPVRPVRLPELFGGHDTLLLYSFMYSPDMDRPCRMCTSLLDGLDGAVPDLAERTAFAVVAKSLVSDIRSYARERGWANLRLVSSSGTT